MIAGGTRRFLLCARTDALAVEGLEAAIDRAGRYRETGVDMLFVQGADTAESLRRVCQAVPGLHLANVSQATSGAKLTVAEAQAAGAAAVMFPIAGLLAAVAAMEQVFAALKRDRSLDAVAPSLMPMARYNELTGLAQVQANEDRWGPLIRDRLFVRSPRRPAIGGIHMRRDIKELQNISLASLGGLLEYFDFQVYVFVAASLSLVIFPPGDSVWKSQVQAFGIFAIGYLVRPIAGIVVAHYADRIGRKRLFVFTVLMMSVPTFLMGLLPTYAVAGWMAPAALLLLRILQGCAVGGELPGAAVFICEHAQSKRLGLASGLFLGMVNFGLLLGAGAALIAKNIAGLDPALASLAWRLPFILGGVCGLLAAYLRRHLAESPMFEQIRATKQISARAPLATVLQDYPKQCLFAFALTFVFATTPGIYFQWLPTYLIGLRHFSVDGVFQSNVFGVMAFVISMPAWGLLRERVGWSRLLGMAAVLNAGAAICFFSYLPTLSDADGRLTIALMIVGVLSGIPHSLIAGLISALFPTQIRQSGYALPYSFGTAIVSGMTPLAIAWLVRSYGLGAPIFQEVLAGLVAMGLAVWVRRMPLHLGGPTISELHPSVPIEAAG